MSNIVLRLDVDRVDLVGAGCNTASFIKFIKGRTETMTLTDILEKMTPEHAKVITDHVSALEASASQVATLTADLEKSKATVTDLQETITKLEKQKPVIEQDDPEKLIKGLPDDVKNLVESTLAKAKADSLALQKFLDDQKTKDATILAKSLKALPIEEADLVAVIKNADEKTLEILTKSAETIEKSLLTPVGTTGGSDNGFEGKDAWSQLEKAAKKVADAQNITLEKAISVVMDTNPELYEAYTKEVRG